MYISWVVGLAGFKAGIKRRKEKKVFPQFYEIFFFFTSTRLVTSHGYVI